MTVKDILQSEHLDNKAIQIHNSTSSLSDECYVSGLLQSQYATLDLNKILSEHTSDEIVDFINRYTVSQNNFYKIKSESRINDLCKLSETEITAFLSLAMSTERIPKEYLSKSAPILTTRSFLKMCRLVYDATTIWQYPPETSTALLFCEERMCSFEAEHDEGILGVDWDDPKQFAQAYGSSYHPEELWFGGTPFYIHDETARKSDNCYAIPEAYTQWTGYVWCGLDLYQTVKMYLALRKNGYPVYCHNYKDIQTDLQLICR